MTICNQWWRAPRYDAPLSVDVNHVCGEPAGHDGEHRCVCGASTASRWPAWLRQLEDDRWSISDRD